MQVELLAKKDYVAQLARADSMLVPPDTQVFVIKGLPGAAEEPVKDQVETVVGRVHLGVRPPRRPVAHAAQLTAAADQGQPHRGGRLRRGRSPSTVAAQLGRDPHPVTRVVARCPFGYPAAVEDLPYGPDGAPFPTLYYLTCPSFVAAVSRLESEGGVRRWTERAAADPALRRSLAEAAAVSRRRRRALAERSGRADERRRRLARRAGSPACATRRRSSACTPTPPTRWRTRRTSSDAPCSRRSRTRGAGTGGAPRSSRSCIVRERARELARRGSAVVKVAIVDLGTNTCRLFLAEVGEGTVTTVDRVTTVVRLGQDVDRTRRLAPEAVLRTRDCLAAYAKRIEEYGPERRLLVATSVLRDAGDGRAFLDDVRRDFDLPSRVLAGRQEAELSFRGGTAGLDPASGPVVLVDIGGGSTEFAAGLPGEAPTVVRSLDIGVVRLTERFVRHDPPEAAELEELAGFVREAIAAGVPAAARSSVHRMIGVAGTYTTLVAHKLHLREYRSDLVHGHELSLADIDAAITLFAALSNDERGLLTGIQKGREDVILAGTLIAREACAAFGLDAVRVSEADILEGAARALAEGTLAPD